MPMFYRGAGVNTYWHKNDARLTGFIPHHPGAGYGLSRLVQHIGRGTTISPFVLLTRSFAVALAYALAGQAHGKNPARGCVYEVEIEESDGFGTRLIDPVVEIAKSLGSPYDMRSYHHDGDPTFLLGIADPQGHAAQLQQQASFPPPGEGTPRPPMLHIELEALVRALRDAEVLAFGAISAAQVRRRIDMNDR